MLQIKYLSAVLFIISICSSCTFNIPNLEERHNQAIAFAQDSLEKIGQHWDAKVFIQRSDPRLKEVGDPTPVFKRFANILGPIKKIGPIQSTGNESLSIAAFNRPDYAVALKSNITCQSGPATVTLGVNHQNDQWFLSAFYVDSKLLKKMNGGDRSASKQYVMRVAPLICGNLDIDYIKQYADPKMIEKLKIPSN